MDRGLHSKRFRETGCHRVCAEAFIPKTIMFHMSAPTSALQGTAKTKQTLLFAERGRQAKTRETCARP